MSVKHYDLAQRFAAAARQQPVARMSHVPVLAPSQPVFAVTEPDGDPGRVTFSTGTGSATAVGRDVLQVLADLGVTASGAHRTLVVPDRNTLAVLHQVAARYAKGSSADVAAVVDWWAARAEHPGSGAVLDLTRACSLRWVTGETPHAERHLDTWIKWLRVPPDATAVRSVTAALVDGETLPGLAEMNRADTRSWQYLLKRHAAGADWRRSDNRRQAALGLRTRCDATELYASLLLGDPLVAVGESFTGTIVPGTVVSVADASAVVGADRLLCRLRAGQAFTAWGGEPADVATRRDAGHKQCSGTVAATSVTADGVLLVTLANMSRREHGRLREGDRLTVAPQFVDHDQQQRGRANLSSRYREPTWLAGARPPSIRRRAVPIDVVIAAAEQ